MKVLDFEIDTNQLVTNQASLSDTMRMAFYEADEELFELLDYDDDTIFLEPTLFCRFLSDIKPEEKIPLVQSVLGYMPVQNWPKTILLKADILGLINLPNLGYIRAEPNATIDLETKQIAINIVPNQFIKNSTIRLCLHPTDHLTFGQEGIVFDEPIEQTLTKNTNSLYEATSFFQKHLPDFWQVLQSVTREFVVFSSSPAYHSFAGIMQHGTAYFNVENKTQTAVFFIDDIAHQCGHIIFNALTLETDKYLKVPKDQPLNGFVEAPNETRGVYGAFHGLFTYTTILNGLDKVLDLENEFTDDLCHEAIGRMGFYIQKFMMDLKSMGNTDILTEEGINYWKQFAEGCQYIAQKYGDILQPLDYSNQPYTFQYDLFKTLNPIQDPA